MSVQQELKIVVGVDGSESSLDAVRWAAAEASSRGGSLRLIHAWIWPMMRVPLGPAPGVSDGGFAAEAQRVLQIAADVARTTCPDVTVQTELVTGAPKFVLAVASHEADLLVLGNRGLGGFTGMLMGSVAVGMAQRAACPVVIVRGEVHPSGPVAVGVDGSPTDVAVLTAAFERAAREGAPVLAIHAVEPPSTVLPAAPWSGDSHELTIEARQLLERALAPFIREHPEVTVDTEVLTTAPAVALVAASKHARIVVVGSRAAGAIHGLVMGSVCHGVIYHAGCPVEVVRVAPALAPVAQQTTTA